MYILGISCYYHDSAAAVLKDGQVIAAVEEERFSREKNDDGFPKLAIDYCMKEAGITGKDLACVAFYDKTVLKLDRLLDNYISAAPRGLYSFTDVIPKWLQQLRRIPTLIPDAKPVPLNRPVCAVSNVFLKD